MTRAGKSAIGGAGEAPAEALNPVDVEPTRIDPHQNAAQVAFSQRIGARIERRRVVRALDKLVTVADILELQHIKSSKAYRGLQLLVDEKLVTVARWEDYCLHVEGRSREQVDEDLRNIKAFGPAFLEEAQKLGVGYRQLRDMRRVPVDQHAQLIEAAKSGDQDALLDLIDQHSREKEKLQKELQDRDVTLTARQTMLDKATAKTLLLEERLSRPYIPSDEDVAKTAEENALLQGVADAVTRAQAGLQDLAVILSDLDNSSAGKAVRAAAHTNVEYLSQRLARLIVEHDIPVDFEDEVKPSWVTAAEAKLQKNT